jgi:hypothetical protein
MNESDSEKEQVMCIGHVTDIAGIERTIAHMEADVAFHQSQCRMFEKLLKVEQQKLAELQSNSCSCCEESNS